MKGPLTVRTTSLFPHGDILFNMEDLSSLLPPALQLILQDIVDIGAAIARHKNGDAKRL